MPVRSMTGAGTHVVEAEAGRIEAEARSVNHRFLKSTVRPQGPLPGATAAVEAALRKHLRRGHVTVHLRYRPSEGGAAQRIDDAAFGQAARQLAALAARHGLDSVTARDVLSVPGVLGDPLAAEDDEAIQRQLLAAVDGVVAELQASREREGAALAEEIEALLAQIGGSVARISERAGDVPRAYRAKLQKRLEELLEGTGHAPDPAQVARECALMAEKADVREEIARLEAHVAHARALLEEGGPVGRRLDFLTQELHREANTIASKTNDMELGRTVLDLRASVERLREQVQNLE